MRIRRSGLTLSEVVMCMSIGSAVMLLAIYWVHQTMVVASKTRRQTDHQRTLFHLSRQIRSDVHQAINAELSEADTLSLNGKDGDVIRYRIEGPRVTRVRGESQQQATEEYKLDENASIDFSILETPNRVSVNVDVASTSNTATHRKDLSLEIGVGRWNALERGSAESP